MTQDQIFGLLLSYTINCTLPAAFLTHHSPFPSGTRGWKLLHLLSIETWYNLACYIIHST